MSLNTTAFYNIFTKFRSPACYSSKQHLRLPSSKTVDVAITAPAPEGLALEIEQETKRTPQRHKTHVGQDRWHETGLHNPRSDESAKAIIVSRHSFTSSKSRWSFRTYSEKPYPHTFLFTVMATMSGPATGL